MLLRLSTIYPKTFEEYQYDTFYCEDILGFIRIYLAFEDAVELQLSKDLCIQRLELNKKIMKGMNYGKPIES